MLVYWSQTQCSNFFDRTNLGLRFGQQLHLDLKTLFPVSFEFLTNPEWHPTPHFKNISIFFLTFCICIFYFFRYGGCTWPPEIGKHGFSPEMDVSERDKKNLKSRASNFEKQKNGSILLKRSSQLRKQIIWWMSTWVPIWSRISKSRFFGKTLFCNKK